MGLFDQRAFEARITIDGDTQYARAFELYSHEAKDFREALTDIGHDLIEAIEQQFLTEGVALTGKRWTPLDPDYAVWKDTHAPLGPGAPILQFSGRMRSEMTTFDRTIVVLGGRLYYDVQTPYVKYHQQGGSIPGRPPMREIVTLPGHFRRQVDRRFQEWLIGLRRGPLRHS